MVCPALNTSRQHLYSGSSLKNWFNKNLLEKSFRCFVTCDPGDYFKQYFHWCMVCYDRIRFENRNIEKIIFKVQIKFLAIHITNQKIKFCYIYSTKYLHGTIILIS